MGSINKISTRIGESLQFRQRRYVLRSFAGHSKLEQYEFAKLTNDLGILRNLRAVVDGNNDVIVVEKHQPQKTGTYGGFP